MKQFFKIFYKKKLDFFDSQYGSQWPLLEPWNIWVGLGSHHPLYTESYVQQTVEK